MGIRQPGMERIKRTLDRHADGEQAHDHLKGQAVLSGGRQDGNALLDIRHQKMSGDIVENADSDQEQSGSEQAHDQIPGRRDKRLLRPAEHHDGAGGDRVDLHKHICGKQIVGVDQRKHGAEQKVDHQEIAVDLRLLHIMEDMLHAAKQRQHHHQAEHKRHQRLKHADADLISERGREMSHPVNIVLAGPQRKLQHCRRHHADRRDGAEAEVPCGLWL